MHFTNVKVSKAFYPVNVTLLLSKLILIDIPLPSITWLHSYLYLFDGCIPFYLFSLLSCITRIHSGSKPILDIPLPTITWLPSYLSLSLSLSLMVAFHITCSPFSRMSQGSILAPLLFLFLINVLPSPYFLYADVCFYRRI